MITPIYYPINPYPRAFFQCFPIIHHNAVDYKATIWKSHRGLRVETNSIFLRKELGFSSNSWFEEKRVLDSLAKLDFYAVPQFYITTSWYDLWEIKKMGVGKLWFEIRLRHLGYRKFDITGRLKGGRLVIKDYESLSEAEAIGLFMHEYRKHEPDVIWVMEI